MHWCSTYTLVICIQKNTLSAKNLSVLIFVGYSSVKFFDISSLLTDEFLSDKVYIISQEKLIL